MNKDDGGPAFPIVLEHERGDERTYEIFSIGLSVRAWFAGMALKGMLANPKLDCSAEGFVRDALEHADVMVTALKDED